MPDYGAFVNESARIDRPVPGTGPNPNYGRFSVNFDQPVESVQPIDPSQDSEDLIISRRAFDYHNATGRQYIDRLHQHEKRSRNPAEQGTIQKLQAQVNKLREEERVLKERLRLSDRKRVHVEHAWPDLLGAFFFPLEERRPRLEALSARYDVNQTILYWHQLYKLICKEENTTPPWKNYRNTHPHLILVPPVPAEIANEQERAEYMRLDREEGGFLRDETEYPPEQNWISLLPRRLIIRILELTLVFPGKLVHAIARVDQEPAPQDMPRNINGAPSVYHRFHIGRTPTSVIGATPPDELLAPLLVCRQWHFLGSHLFYGCNHFAFSSLGEWGSFANGIGSHLQRLHNIDIFWSGSQYLVFQKSKANRFTSRRTHRLMLLCEARRLSLINIHLRESSDEYSRRGHESSAYKGYMEEKSKKQPNYRASRDLRTLQGADYLKSLRGLNAISIYDYDAFVKQGGLRSVRDYTAIQDLNSQVRRPKDPEDVIRSEWENLAPVSGYEPTRGEWRDLKEVLPKLCHIEQPSEQWARHEMAPTVPASHPLSSNVLDGEDSVPASPPGDPNHSPGYGDDPPDNRANSSSDSDDTDHDGGDSALGQMDIDDHSPSPQASPGAEDHGYASGAEEHPTVFGPQPHEPSPGDETSLFIHGGSDAEDDEDKTGVDQDFHMEGTGHDPSPGLFISPTPGPPSAANGDAEDMKEEADDSDGSTSMDLSGDDL